jgi:DNA invertase Pin-like site-specific DNA recombinase
MPLTLIGYARCTADQHDIDAQRRALLDLGVQEDRIYVDAGHTAAHRNRAGLDQALTALRPGDTLAVHKLGRLACSVADVRAIGQTLADRGARLSIGGTVYDPHDPIGEAFFTALSMVVELQTSIQAVRSRQSLTIAIANGRHVGRPPKLNEDQGVQLGSLVRNVSPAANERRYGADRMPQGTAFGMGTHCWLPLRDWRGGVRHCLRRAAASVPLRKSREVRNAGLRLPFAVDAEASRRVSAAAAARPEQEAARGRRRLEGQSPDEAGGPYGDALASAQMRGRRPLAQSIGRHGSRGGSMLARSATAPGDGPCPRTSTRSGRWPGSGPARCRARWCSGSRRRGR